MSDQSQIGFEQLGLGALLKRYRLIVPPNQRDYAWESEHVDRLFEDIAFAISQDESNYFLGTIVTVPVEDGVLEVIDGQQRLATTSLALAAMRHRVLTDIPNLAQALYAFIENVDSKSLEPSPKMRLNTADTSVFHQLITDGTVGAGYLGARVSHQNLRDAYAAAMVKWGEITKPVGDSAKVVDVFKKWMNYIEFNAKVILLQVPNSVNAFKMFETLNDRGLKTSQADLVKNYVFGESGDSLPVVQEKWGYLKGSLETIDEEDITVNFLRQALICKHGYIKEANVYERVQKAVRGKNTAVKWLTEMEMQAREYAAIFNSGSQKWSAYPLAVKKSLEILSLFDIKPFRPLMLAIAAKFSTKEASKALSGLVSLGVRLIIASSTRSGSVEQPLARAAHQVFDEQIQTSKELYKFLNGVVPSDEQFKSAFSVATVSNPKFARYYLRALEAAHKAESEPWYITNEDTLSINLEHVLPINPENNWPKFTSDEVKIYAKRIGNMALLQVKSNSTLKSGSFATKVHTLKSAPYSTTSMIGDATEWSPDQISQRQKVLADLAVSAWPFPS